MALATSEGYDFTLDVPDIDCSLLIELLEESNGEEIENRDSIDHDAETCEDCGIDDILWDLGGHDCSISPTTDMMAIEEPMNWMEMEMEMEIVSSQDLGDWYINEGDMFYEEQRCHFEYLQDLLVEQVYIPLWQ